MKPDCETANIFADVTNVGQLFDALWYHATSCVQVADDGGTGHSQRDRELAIGDAHKRYTELTDG